MKISVKPDKSVLVSFPFFVTEKEILTFLAQQEEWILRQKAKTGKQKSAITPGMVIETKLHKIELLNNPVLKIEVNHPVILFCAPDYEDESTRNALEKLLAKIYRQEAHSLLPLRLKELATLHGLKYSKVSIRDNRRNWGSCSSRNNISLNLQMMKLPDALIDYILLHELVHTEIKDHSERFWNRLDQFTQGRARELAKMVKKYSTYTL